MHKPEAAPRRRLGSLERPGCRLHYEVTGHGRPIVFAHGLGGNQTSWWQQVAAFASGYTCVTFAHRGFHPSSPIAGGPDPRDYADDLAALIEHLQLSGVCLVAQSMGGWGAIEYALRRTGKLGALVLAATTGTIDPARLGVPEAARLGAWQEASAQARKDLVSRGIHVACGERMVREQPALHLLYRHIDDLNAGLDKEALRARLVALRRRAPEELASLDCPMLFVVADEDIVMPSFAAAALAARLPRAQLAEIPAAGHSAYFERAPLFNRLLAAFLEGAGFAAAASTPVPARGTGYDGPVGATGHG
jgi:pimeloyl-ACP methyl ester carboxylesterase